MYTWYLLFLLYLIHDVIPGTRLSQVNAVSVSLGNDQTRQCGAAHMSTKRARHRHIIARGSSPATRKGAQCLAGLISLLAIIPL